MENYDVIVMGLGAMGSAAAYQLAKRGRRVLGIDRFSPPHAFGSTHGDTRVTRLAIGEGAHYTPLAVRSHEIWREIEAQTGASLLTTKGGLIISSAARTGVMHTNNFFQDTVAAAREHGIAHEFLDAAQIRKRFRQFRIADDEIGYYEPSAGLVRPEECVRAQLALAKNRGAEFRIGETVLRFDATTHDVSVTTERGTYRADTLIVAAGPWLPQLLGRDYAQYFKIFRQTLFWFNIKGSVTPFLPENFPIFIWELQQKKQGIYGFPAIDGAEGGIKIASEAFVSETTADTVNREVGKDEADAMYDTYVAPYLQGIGRNCLKAVSCLYTVTPDFGFVIDRHPQFERVIIASPCSGHGFKHSAAIGEALCELACDGASRFDLSAFKLARFN